MSEKNNLGMVSKKPIIALFEREEVRAKFNALLGERAASFIMSVLQIASENALLATADPTSVYMAAVVAATINLPLNKNLGWAHIVPYKDKKTGKVLAQFQIGYKGYIQLAHRSGVFSNIAATAVYEGQLIETNPLAGHVFDFSKKGEKIIGYAAAFSLTNGFEKIEYWDEKKVIDHANKFSQTFKQGYGVWADNFEAMAKKTILKNILSTYAPLSVEMQTAIIADQGIIKNADTIDVDYIDNKNTASIINTYETEEARIARLISNTTSIDQLMKFKENIPEAMLDMYEEKFMELSNSK